MPLFTNPGLRIDKYNNGYIDLGLASKTAISGDLTFISELKIDSFFSAAAILGKTENSGFDYALHIKSSLGGLHFEYYNSSSTWVNLEVSDTNVFSAKQFFTVVVTRKLAGQICIYVNGVLVTSDNGPATAATGTLSSTIRRVLFRNNQGGDIFIGGYLKYAAIYNRVLSTSEFTSKPRNGLTVEYLFNEMQGTTITDTSGNNNNGTAIGTMWGIKKPFTTKPPKINKTANRIKSTVR